MSPEVKGVLMGALMIFVVWCVYESVLQYNFQRSMDKMEAAFRQRNWMWLLERRIKPLFYEQRIRDEVFGHDV